MSIVNGDNRIDIEQAIRQKVIDASDHPTRQEDYQKVRSFAQLKGRPNRPIDIKIVPRAREEFEAALERLEGISFFDPFNILLELMGRSHLRVEPSQDAIDTWNYAEFVPKLVGEVCDRLDRGINPLLVPRLVSLFLNLERESLPSPAAWSDVDVIAVPGSRTFDRAAEAFRAYLRSGGHAVLVTSGKAPYYDERNESIQLTESEANAAYLRLLGVPDERIIPESHSRDTDENVEFLPEALKRIERKRGSLVQTILLVTSPFHLARYRLSVELMLKGTQRRVFAVGSKASRYWAETYFLTDAKSGYTREATIGVVFNEYLKIAYDCCARRQSRLKATAKRGPQA